jgi:2-phospho-L-lactate/phosphoenolpyruvate guanylyltransferase
VTTTPRLWAVVPVKSPSRAKQRLAPLLDACERRQLACAMFEDVLDACIGARLLAGIAVVTADAEVAAIAGAAGALVHEEAEERGTNAAIAAGISAVTAFASGVIVVPSDVPHATAASIDAAARLCVHANALVLVPASRDGGTNLLACTPPDLIRPNFGPGSFARHCDSAARLGIAPLLPSIGRLDLDLDRPEDIDEFLALPATTRTHRLLLELDVPRRLRPVLAPSRAAAARLAL